MKKPIAGSGSPLRVLIDGYFLQKPYGFGRFAFELFRALGEAETDFAAIVAVPERVDIASLPQYRNLEWHAMPDRIFPIWEQVTIPRLARHLKCDVIHFPYNTSALFTYGIPSVTTVHDLIFMNERVGMARGKDFVAAQYATNIFRLCTARSRSLVSVSQSTGHELGKIRLSSRTVYNTVDGFLAANPPAPAKPAGRPYMLHRGGYLPHRNTNRVIEAFRAVREQLPNLELKVIGAPQGAELWGTESEPDIAFLPRVSDQELATLYTGSSCILATSLQEGFGLPIIEGFGFGAPVITSNIDPMKEIAGDAALLVDPHDSAAIGGAMKAVVSNPVLARSLVAKGHARQKLFSSARVAQQMTEVYRLAAAA